MHTILEKLKTLPQENLFLYWQKELELKKELRQNLCEYRQVQIEDENEYNFLKHSLAYTGHKQTFFNILFLNLNRLQVQSALLAEPQELVQDFLLALPGLIKQEEPTPRDLQFLINIYRENYGSYYTDIIQVLKQQDCEYLLEKTANKTLRKLLKIRQAELITLAQEEHHSLDHLADNHLAYPGLYGDKIKIVKQTLTNIQAYSYKKHLNPHGTDHSEALLDTAQLLFLAGCLGDSLALLRAIYIKEQTQNFSQPSQRSLITRTLGRVLHKTLPMYALLAYPLEAFQKAHNIYQVFFPSLIPDKKTLLYLELYQALTAHRSGNLQYTLLELADIGRSLDKPDEEIDILLKLILQPFDVSGLEFNGLLDNMPEQLTASPHEAYVTLEILRFLEQSQLLSFSRENHILILNHYLALFNWIPSPLFLNLDIMEQMIPGVDELTRQEAERIWQTRHSISPPERFYLL